MDQSAQVILMCVRVVRGRGEVRGFNFRTQAKKIHETQNELRWNVLETDQLGTFASEESTERFLKGGQGGFR